MRMILSAIVFVALFSSCSGYTPPDNACEIEAGLVNLVGAGLQAVAHQFNGVDNPRVDTALAASQAGYVGGQALVAACEHLRDGDSWQEWVGDMLGRATGLAGAISDAVEGDPDIAAEGSDPLPDEFEAALDALRAEQQRF